MPLHTPLECSVLCSSSGHHMACCPSENDMYKGCVPLSYLQAIMELHMFRLAVPAMLWGFPTLLYASCAGSEAPLPSSRSPAPSHRLAACHSAPLHAQATP